MVKLNCGKNPAKWRDFLVSLTESIIVTVIIDLASVGGQGEASILVTYLGCITGHITVSYGG